MAPFWAQTKVAAAPIKKEKRTALAVTPKPDTSPNKRDTFKVASRSHPYILLNPEAAKKLYRRFQSRRVRAIRAAVEDYNSGA
jgi:ADP-heptose:LPS heptosyltransferase